ncbi:MmgE/PrpD family protein [Streptomyces sp. NPDC006544]|uniref:MmgE/PrpD family protein n=1 Tax=Streptomyces sp. NPDC006544 TaxID=3154583 RepID=UPI0033BB5476
MPSTAEQLVQWAHEYVPTEQDLALSRRALQDTVAVTLAARRDPIRGAVGELTDAGRWATLAHVLSFDDLHMPSTTHIGAICVPTVLAVGGGAREYLGAAGVMARLGTVLGWSHYASGWHVTCTAGAPAAAVGAALSLGLDPRQTAAAVALALPAAGGVQRAFGTAGKSLQVGFAAEAGVRAARLVASGAEADPRALDQWLGLVGGDPARLELSGPAVPGGLATKVFPCCYSMQRLISAARRLPAEIPVGVAIESIQVTTPEATVRPLIYDRPQTGMQGQLSLKYAIATAMLDRNPDFDSFTTAAVNRPAAQELMSRTTVELTAGGAGLLDGDVHISVRLSDGTSRSTRLDQPPGSPARPLTENDLHGKFLSCGPDVPGLLADLDWATAASILKSELPAG